MIKSVVIAILLFSCMSYQYAAYAQEEVIGENETENAVNWTYTVIHHEGNHYELQAKATIKKGFHLWALNAGGDGTLIPTSFTIEDGSIQWDDSWKENKRPEEHNYEFIDGAVRYFTGTVTFSRKFSVTHFTEISGTVDFQTCNEEMCFPPETLEFTASTNKKTTTSGKE